MRVGGFTSRARRPAERTAARRRRRLGRADSPLLAQHRERAREAGAKLTDVVRTRMFSSTSANGSSRAKRTGSSSARSARPRRWSKSRTDLAGDAHRDRGRRLRRQRLSAGEFPRSDLLRWAMEPSRWPEAPRAAGAAEPARRRLAGTALRLDRVARDAAKAQGVEAIPAPIRAALRATCRSRCSSASLARRGDDLSLPQNVIRFGHVPA